METGNAKINVAVENGVKELVIRHGQAEELQKLHYRGYGIESAWIGAVNEYLQRAGIEPELIKDSFVTFSYEDLYINLEFNVRFGLQDKINGVLKLHPDLKKWDINSGKPYTNLELAQFIKMNRHYFDEPAEAMTLVSELQQLKVKTERDLERADNRKGDSRAVIAQKVIESNIPDFFTLKLPVFVGAEAVKFPVEIEVNAHDFGCVLISPSLKQIIDQETKAIIDEQLDKIRTLYPELRIFQK